MNILPVRAQNRSPNFVFYFYHSFRHNWTPKNLTIPRQGAFLSPFFMYKQMKLCYNHCCPGSWQGHTFGPLNKVLNPKCRVQVSVMSLKDSSSLLHSPLHLKIVYGHVNLRLSEISCRQQWERQSSLLLKSNTAAPQGTANVFNYVTEFLLESSPYLEIMANHAKSIWKCIFFQSCVPEHTSANLSSMRNICQKHWWYALLLH